MRTTPDLFSVAATHQAEPDPALFPRTFATPTTAFHLNNRPDLSRSTVNEVSIQYKIPDLLQASHDFFSHFLHDQTTRTISGRRGPAWNASTIFEEVRVWHSVQVQTHSQIGPGVAEPHKLFMSPPSEAWPNGRCDTALFAQDVTAGPLHPPLGLTGKPDDPVRSNPYNTHPK